LQGARDVSLFSGHIQNVSVATLACREPETVDAVVVFDQLAAGDPGVRYRIRMNHTHLPSNRQRLDFFSPAPNEEYKRYWFFVNLQVWRSWGAVVVPSRERLRVLLGTPCLY
jgi:hypothetical protein